MKNRRKRNNIHSEPQLGGRNIIFSQNKKLCVNFRVSYITITKPIK